MPRGNYTIQRSCEECGKIFTPPTLMSKYCCPTCSKRAYKKRQIAKEKEAIRQALVRRIPSNKGYLTVKESVLIYGISKDVLYRMIRQGLIPSYNFGQRLTRLSRQYMDEHFKTKAGSRKRKKEALSFEPKDCYTIGEIAKKFHINDSSVFKHIRRHSIPTCRFVSDFIVYFFIRASKNLQKSSVIQNNSVTLSSVIIAIIVCISL